jgi:tetratricopeptide (TPR) repeat protein
MRLPAASMVIAFSCFLLAGNATAQRPGLPSKTTLPDSPTVDPFSDENPNSARGSAQIVVSVVDDSGMPLVEQALVKLYSETTNTNTWGTTQKRSEVTFDSVLPGDYEVETSAAGYETATQTVSVLTRHEVFDVLVRLKHGSRDDAQAAKPGQLLAPRALKEAERGLAGLKAGNLNDAQKHLEAAYKMAPTDADLNFLMGLLYQQKKDMGQAEAYFVKSASFDPNNVRALTSLGQVLLLKGDYKGAAEPLEKAVSVNDGSWQAHWELASAYLHLQRYEESRQQAQLAIQTGKGAANDAEFLLGEALSHLGKAPEAIQALQTYLQTNPKSEIGPEVRDMIAQLQNPPKEVAGTSPTPVALKIASGPASPLDTPGGRLSIPSWSPPDVDDAQPVVAAGAVCPSQMVIEKAGDRVKELVDNLARFDATEDVVHESLDDLGRPIAKDSRKFDYQVEISEPQPGVLKINEYRNGLTDQGDFPGNIAARGLPALAFVFHPEMRGSFDLVCEGLGDWHGQATWLVHFRQRTDKPSRLQSFDTNDESFAVDLKGRAWISASTYQIVRLEADLVRPLRQMQLLTEHQEVEYGPVQFQNRKMQLWLPISADLYMDCRRQRFHRRHSFAHYMLFSVGSSQKISQPKIPDPDEQKPSS